MNYYIVFHPLYVHIHIHPAFGDFIHFIINLRGFWATASIENHIIFSFFYFKDFKSMIDSPIKKHWAYK